FISAQVTKAPEIVHPKNMIRVAVREDHHVDVAHPMLNTLQTELLRRVDLHVKAVHHHVNAGARPPVPRIIGGADFTITGDHRHSLRSAGTQKQNFHTTRKRTDYLAVPGEEPGPF